MSGQIPPSPTELLELTVILPVFNEVENLPLLWPELIGVLDAHWRHVEIIFVDDVSTDGSTDWIRELARRDGRVRHVRSYEHLLSVGSANFRPAPTSLPVRYVVGG
jgi:glycosyltransferase involved in cell wall biosynthesis